MQISNDGQLAEFFTRYRIDRPDNLCSLFWTTILFPILFTILGTLAVLIAFSAIAMPILIFLWGTFDFHGWFIPFFILAVLSYCVLIAWGLVEVGTRLGRRGSRVRLPRFKFAREVIRAIKEKYCPLIEWTDHDPHD